LFCLWVLFSFHDPFIWFADEAHRRAPCWGPSRSSCELDFFSFRSSLILHREITGAMCGLRHAAANVALGHHNLSPKLEQLPRSLRRGAGESRPGASAASPVHEPRNRPAVIDVSMRGVLVSQIAISAGHASIGQPKRAPPNLLRRSRLVCKSSGTTGLNVDIIGNYESLSQ